MTGKKAETILYSLGGVVLMFLLLVAFNFISGLGKVRVDLTEEKLHTLTDGTKAILSDIDGEVELRFYCTRDENTPVILKTFATRVEDLLDEYRQHSGGKLVVKRLNPQPLSDAEDSARLDGIQAQRVQTGDQFYLGIAVSFLDATETIPVLTMQRENLLEYDISRAIANVLVEKKPVVGVMTGLPAMGGPPNPMAMRMGQMQGTEPWMVVSMLKKDFEVEEVGTDVEVIEDKVDVLLLAHPKGLSDKTLYAIDQFILRGGKLIALMDPMPLEDPSGVQQNMMGMNMSEASSLGKLLDAWGITFDGQKVIADMTYTTQLGDGRGGVQVSPTWLSLTDESMDKDDVVFGQVDNLIMPLVGHFTGEPKAGLTKTSLMKSSEKSQLVERIMAQISADSVKKDFRADGKQYDLAIRLSGTFPSAFPEGKPKADADSADKDGEAKAAGGHLKESKGENAVILIGDADFIADRYSVRVQNFFGPRLIQYVSGNISLVQSLVEQMAGDSNLIGTRSRAIKRRPFTVVKELQAKAQDEYRGKIKEREDKIADLQKKLNELQRNKSADQQMVLSPEQQKEIESFQKQEAEQRKELKEIRKDLRKDIDALENKLKWANILGMPCVFVLLGIGVAVFKRKSSSAR